MRKKQAFRKPYRVGRRKSLLRSRFFWRSILFLFLAGEIFYIICFFIPFQIKEIKISGNEKIGTAALESFVENQISKKIIFFPAKSIFLINSRDVEEKALELFSQAGIAKLEKKFPDGLLFRIEERRPLAVFIQDQKNFLIDKEGIIFEEVSPDSSLLTIQKTVENGSRSPKLGERVLENKLMAAILGIEDKAENELRIPIAEILIVSEERLNVKTKEGWEIYFNPQKEISWQLTKLKALLEKEVPESSWKNLEYVELRFGNLSPYKYR